LSTYTCKKEITGQNFTPCSTRGYDELHGLCPDHYRELVVLPASEAEFTAARYHFDCLVKLIRVEQLLGLRPKPYESGELHIGKPKQARTSKVGHLSASVLVETSEDLDLFV
jgi:hypothetical protein